MKTGYFPFYSQQSKKDGSFLHTCGNVKQLAYLARPRDVAAIPNSSYDASPFKCELRSVVLPPNNPVQRIHWNTEDLFKVFHDCDVAVTNSEYLAIPLRALFPELPIVQMCSVCPDDDIPMFTRAWKAADLVVAQGPLAASRIRSMTRTPVTHWSLAYDERLFCEVQPRERDVDVCFVQRCSANNATHHLEYLEAQEYKTVYTDVTHYLRIRRPDLEYCTPSTYIQTLFRSKVAVSMYDSWYGGMSIREAIRAGCVPVVLDAPCYVELCGKQWPFYVRQPVTVDGLRRVVRAALDYNGPLPSVSGESYQAGALKALEDIRDCVSRRS